MSVREDVMLARIDELEAKVARLESQEREAQPGPNGHGQVALSRRRLLGIAGAAAAGAAGTALATAAPAGAATGPML
jgi:hypothetical protein